MNSATEKAQALHAELIRKAREFNALAKKLEAAAYRAANKIEDQVDEDTGYTAEQDAELERLYRMADVERIEISELTA